MTTRYYQYGTRYQVVLVAVKIGRVTCYKPDSFYASRKFVFLSVPQFTILRAWYQWYLYLVPGTTRYSSSSLLCMVLMLVVGYHLSEHFLFI